MKRIVIILLGVALLCTAVAIGAKAVNTYQVTGPVTEVRGDVIVVQKGKASWELVRDANTKVTGGEVQKGKTVTIQYKMIATEITVK